MGGATEGTTAHLILESMKFWSPKTHQLHPALREGVPPS